MSERIIMVIFNAIMLLTVLVMQTLITKISRKNILLGVSLPEDKRETDEVKKIIIGFTRENIIVGTISLIIISFLIYSIDNINFLVISTFLYIGILFLVYARWNKKVKNLKKEKEWDKLESKVSVVDTEFSRDRGNTGAVSKKWFLIPLGIVILNAILVLFMYSSLPTKIPMHWDFKGNIDGYMNKTILTAMFMPIMQLFVGLVIYASYMFMIKSKQQINSKDPKISLKRNVIFRNIWSIYFIVILIAIELLLTPLNMASLGLFSNMGMYSIVSLIVYGFILIGSIVIGLVVGQGGERLKLGEDKEVSRRYEMDDDKFWKLANSIYYNPNDPSVFVEKRVGIGWTVNTGRLAGMFIMILPFIIIAITLFFIR